MLKLTKPVLDRAEVSSLIEDNIEDDHDTDHRVEGGQGSHRGEFSVIVNNHEGEEDEDSGYEIHQHLQHQNDDVQRGQCSIFVVVTEQSVKFRFISIRFNLL